MKATIITLTSLPMLFSGIVFVRSFVAEDKSNALRKPDELCRALLQSYFYHSITLLLSAGFLLTTAPFGSELNERLIPEFVE